MLFVLTNDRFPVGTSVGAYRATAEWPGAGTPPPTQGPKSVAVDTQVIGSGSTLTFSGLDADTPYFAAALVAGGWRWVRFRTSPSLAASYEVEDPEDFPFTINVPADQAVDVFRVLKGGADLFHIDKDGVLTLQGASAAGQPLVLRARWAKNAMDYGAIADGTSHPLSERYGTLAAAQAVYAHATALTNEIDWCALQAAINAAAASSPGGGWAYAPAGHYMLHTPVTIPDFVTLSGDGEITILENPSVASAKCITNADLTNGNQGIAIRDLTVDRRQGADGLDVFDDAIHCRFVDRLHIWGVRARGGTKSVHVQGCTGAMMYCHVDSFRDNGIAVNDPNGVGLASLAEPGFTVATNRIVQTAATKGATGSSPIIVTEPNATIHDNHITSTVALNGYGVEVGMAAVAGGDIKVTDNKLRGCGILVGSGARCQVSGNVSVDGQVAGGGRIVVATTGAQPGGAADYTDVHDNIVVSSDETFGGIRGDSGSFTRIASNRVFGGTRINVGSNDATIEDNTVHGAPHAGYFFSAGARMTIRGNTARNCGQDAAGAATTKVGFTFDNLADPTIEDNWAISSLGAPNEMRNGFYVNLCTNIAWRRNGSRGHTVGVTTTTNAQTWYSGDDQPQVASASNLVLPMFSDNFRITGATQIDTMSVTGQKGRRVTLIFGGAITLKNGGNTALAGAADFAATLSDAITLVCDGANWFEVARSVN